MRKMKLRKLITELETGGEYEQAKQVRETYRGNKRMVGNLAKCGTFGLQVEGFYQSNFTCIYPLISWNATKIYAP
jgi:hypothetical protein